MLVGISTKNNVSSLLLKTLQVLIRERFSDLLKIRFVCQVLSIANYA